MKNFQGLLISPLRIVKPSLLLKKNQEVHRKPKYQVFIVSTKKPNMWYDYYSKSAIS